MGNASARLGLKYCPCSSQLTTAPSKRKASLDGMGWTVKTSSASRQTSTPPSASHGPRECLLIAASLADVLSMASVIPQHVLVHERRTTAPTERPRARPPALRGSG